MKRLAAALAALAILAPAAEAHRAGRVHNDRHVARDVWGSTRCDTGFWTTPIRRERGLTRRTGYAGVAQWIDWGIGNPRTACVIIVDDRRWGSEYLCRLIVHEFGHLAGHEHVMDPSRIMYAGTLPRFQPCITRRSRRV